jgi:hypothetical protein
MQAMPSRNRGPSGQPPGEMRAWVALLLTAIGGRLLAAARTDLAARPLARPLAAPSNCSGSPTRPHWPWTLRANCWPQAMVPSLCTRWRDQMGPEFPSWDEGEQILAVAVAPRAPVGALALSRGKELRLVSFRLTRPRERRKPSGARAGVAHPSAVHASSMRWMASRRDGSFCPNDTWPCSPAPVLRSSPLSRSQGRCGA